MSVQSKIEIPTAEEDTAITTAALNDPDNQPLSDIELSQFKRRGGRPKSLSPKISATIRLDADVLSAFRNTGQGWQTRMNSALREWLLY